MELRRYIKLLFLYIEPHVFHPYRLKSSVYTKPPSIQTKPISPTLSTDVSSNPTWPLVGCPRPASNSFSEVENQQQQLRRNTNLSSSYGGSPSNHPVHHRNQSSFPNDINYQRQTLYSLNQPTNGETTPPSRKRLSLADFPVEEVKGKINQ
jgi:hypothetical protein